MKMYRNLLYIALSAEKREVGSTYSSVVAAVKMVIVVFWVMTPCSFGCCQTAMFPVLPDTYPVPPLVCGQ